MRNRKDKVVAEFSFIVGLLVVFAVGIPLRAQTDLRYGVAESKDVMVAMRDGVKLAADIYRPTQNGQLADASFQCFWCARPITRTTPHRARTLLSLTDTSSFCRMCVAATNQRDTGVRTTTTRTTDSIPHNGSAHSPGAMAASARWARRMAVRRNTRWPLGTHPTSKPWFPATQCRTTDATAFAIMVPSSYASSNGSSLSAMPPELQTRSRRPNAPQAIPPPRKPW